MCRGVVFRDAVVVINCVRQIIDNFDRDRGRRGGCPLMICRGQFKDIRLYGRAISRFRQFI